MKPENSGFLIYGVRIVQLKAVFLFCVQFGHRCIYLCMMYNRFIHLLLQIGWALVGLLPMGCHQYECKLPAQRNNASRKAPTNTPDYAQCKQHVMALKKQCAAQWQGMTLEKKQHLFTQVMADSILPYWLGTPWGFYGTSETPGQGQIACGYFVTTTLRDAGLALQRTKLAQCASEQMIGTLVQRAHIQRFSHVPLADFVMAIKKQGYGLYIIGLDSHTGFLYHNGQELYFIHASYIGAKVVTKELAGSSVILQASRYRVTGKISADAVALDKWAKQVKGES